MKNLIYAMVALGMVFLTSCDKSNEEFESIADLSTGTEQTISYMESLLNDVEEDVDEAILNLESHSRSASNCPIKTWESEKGIFPNTLTIDYGDGCVGRNGRTRVGKILVTVSDTLKNVGSTRTLVFDNFSIDTTNFAGQKTWENLALDAEAGTVTIHRTSDLALTFSDGSGAEWNLDHQITKSIFLVKRTPKAPKRIQQFKATIEVIGSSSGINRNGNSFQAEIVSPLFKPEDCLWFASGIREVTRDGAVATLNYGDGTCDRKATVRLPDGTTKEVPVKPFWSRKR